MVKAKDTVLELEFDNGTGTPFIRCPEQDVDESHDSSESTDDARQPFNLKRIFRRRRKLAPYIPTALMLLFLAGYIIYAVIVVYMRPRDSLFICLVGVFLVYYISNKTTGGKCAAIIGNFWTTIAHYLTPRKNRAVWIRRCITVVAVLAIFIFLVIDLWSDLERWTPLLGIIVFIVISVAFSKHPTKINWMLVTWGLIMQFVMGMIVLKWQHGYMACHWVGNQIETFFAYTDRGSEFVFGPAYIQHPIVFKVFPVVIFFSSMISVLYYIGAMQPIFVCISSTLQYTMSATPVESFATAIHIFVSLMESSVILRPVMMSLTESEIHAIMTGGFATVAGAVIAIYVEFGIPAEHVLAASFMSAPAALAIAKISIPETEVSKIKSNKDLKIPKGEENSLVEALAVGATHAITVVAYIVANLIAFIAALAFFDTTLGYFGGMVGCPQLSFQLICSYVFMPLAVVMGIPWSESNIVGSLIGKKIMINEFLAYIDMKGFAAMGLLSSRSEVLATYILCGFGNIASIGINLGSLTSAAPDRRTLFAHLSWRSLINGNIASFMTACIAGLLYSEQVSSPEVLMTSLNSSSLAENVTMPIFEIMNTTLTTLVS